MKIIRSLNGDSHMLNDFYYALSEKQNPPEESFNSYYFKSGVFNNVGSNLYDSFLSEMKEESFVVNIGTSIINIGNLNALEISPKHSTFVFHFLNNTKFYFETTDEMKDPQEFSGLCKILCETISEIEKAEKRSIIHGEGKGSSPLYSLPNFIKN